MKNTFLKIYSLTFLFILIFTFTTYATTPASVISSNTYEITGSTYTNANTQYTYNNAITISGTTSDGFLSTNGLFAIVFKSSKWQLIEISTGTVIASSPGPILVSGSTPSNVTWNNGVTGALVLPIKWLNINGDYVNNLVTIRWQVEELDILKYQVEQSSDGINFTTVTSIYSKSNAINNYTFSLNENIGTVKYYRIKQIDKQDKYSYSTLIKLTSYNSSHFNVYPNPAKNNVTINVDNNLINTNLQLLDINGKFLKSILINHASTTLDISNQQSGMYLLKTTDGKLNKLIIE